MYFLICVGLLTTFPVEMPYYCLVSELSQHTWKKLAQAFQTR